MGTLKSSDLLMNSNKMFSKQDYGKPIGEALSTVLRRNLSKTDYANIAARSSISFSTVRDVVYRSNSLTESNAVAIKLLVHAAFENSIAYKIQAEGDTVFLEKLLKV